MYFEWSWVSLVSRVSLVSVVLGVIGVLGVRWVPESGYGAPRPLESGYVVLPCYRRPAMALRERLRRPPAPRMAHLTGRTQLC